MASRASWGARILRVVDHVQAHAGEDIEPEVLADIAGMSVHHFHRVFRGMVGESVMGFVRRLRLERAAQRLRFDDTPVTELAFDAGYASHEAFTRAFRSRFGESPSDYRKNTRVEVEPPTVEFRELPYRMCIGRRHVGPYDTCGKSWDELTATLGRSGLLPAVRTSLGLCYDDPDVTAGERLRYDACVELAGGDAVALPEGCVRREVPAGRYAVTIHHGPYETILDTYIGLIGRYLPFHDVELANEPVVEIYVNDPSNTAPEDLVTEVCVRVA